MADTPPVTITSVLQTIFDDVGEPILIAALAASGPIGAAIAAVLNLPIIGGWITSFLNSTVNGLISAGVIELKVTLISYLSASAQTKWAAQLTILKQVSDAGKTLTPEEQAAYEAALQNLVRNHPGVVNA